MAGRARVRRWVVAAVLGAALGAARDAGAHGGQYRGPRGGVPPGLPPPTTSVPGGWWDANLDELVGDARGPTVTGEAADLARVQRVAREERIVPFLRTVVDGALGSDPDLVGAAAIALGKTSSDPADVDRLLRLGDDPSRPSLLLEAAALAPGLLRRSDPALALDGRVLDRVRARLLDVVDGKTHGSRRVRCFAALSLGLLGDQPSPPDDAARPRVDVATALGARLAASDDPEEEVAFVTALGLQAPASVPAPLVEAVRALAADGGMKGRRRAPVTQAHALLATARWAGPEASALLLSFLRSPQAPNEVRHAALAALGTVAARLGPVPRTAAVTEVLAHAEAGNPETVGLALLTLGRLHAAAMGDPADRTTFTATAATRLLAQVDEGAGAARRIAALAVGFALRPTAPEPADVAKVAFRQRAVAMLGSVVDDGSDPEVRGVALIALGLARDPGTVARCTALLKRRDIDVQLRARAATALGLVGDPTPAPLEALRVAVAPTSPEGVRREAARALGLLGDASALAPLVAELRSDVPDAHRSRAAVALGALRRTGAVDALIAVVADRTAGDVARAIAVAALGLLGDPERVRSLGRLASDLSGTAQTDALGQAVLYL